MMDTPPVIPASLDVTFPSSGNASTDPPFFRVKVTLASLGLTQFDSTLSVNAFATGILPRNETALWSSGSVTNAAALTALATQAAKDWYLYQLGKLDIVFAGLAPWTPEGTSDYVEWTQTKDIVSTRVQRGTALPYVAQSPARQSIFTGGDLNSFRRPLVHYTCPVTGQSLHAGFLRDNQILAVPYPVPRTEAIVSIGFRLDTVGPAGSLLRCAIYDSDPVSYDPKNLLFDGGDQVADVTDGGVWHDVVISPSLIMNSGNLYWLCIQGNDTAYAGGGGSGVQFGYVDQVMLYNFRGLGGDGDETAKFWIATPFTYGPYPATFPMGGSTEEGGNAPAVAVIHG